jgi:tetratricopeptide (TPR) repeat protein
MPNKIEKATESLDYAFAHFMDDEYEECISKCKHALRLIEKSSDKNNELEEEVLFRLGEAYYYLEDYDSAKDCYLKSVEILKSFENKNNIIIDRLIDIGRCYTWKEDWDNAISFCENAIELTKEVFGRESEQYYENATILAYAYYLMENYEAAIKIYKEAITYREGIYEADDNKLNEYKNSLANTYYCSENLYEAYQLFKDVYRYSDSEDVENENRLLTDILDSAERVKTSDDLSDYYEPYVKNSQELNGDTIDTAEISFKAGKYFDTNKDYVNAEKYYNISYSIYKEVNGESDKATLKTAQFLSVVYYQLSNYDEAERLTKYLIEENSRLPDNDAKNLTLSQNMGYIYYYKCEYNKSEKYFNQALELSTSLFGEFDSRTNTINLKIADVLYWREDYELSINHVNSFLSAYLKIENPEKDTIAKANRIIADSYSELPGKTNDSLFHFSKALEIYKTIYGDKHKSTLDTYYEISRIYYSRMKNYDSAEKYLDIFLENSEGVLNNCSKDILRSQLRLAELKFQQQNDTNYSRKLVISTLTKINNHIVENNNNVASALQKIHIDFLHLLVDIDVKQTNIVKAKESLQLSYELCKNYCDKSDYRLKKQLTLMRELSNISDEQETIVIPNEKESYLKFIQEKLDEPMSKRRVRIFISSTFRDMMDEREYLIKQIFPKLKTLCRERGIDFSEVDLRWGVTEEDVEQGKVIEICLDEIDRSRPYFIGILGERYGWVPTSDCFSNYERIINNYDWIKDDFEEGLSITEMEIQYGVLRNPAMIGNAFFYFRDEKLTPGEDEFREDEGSEYHVKLDKLKTNLKEQSEFPVKDFNSIEQLGDDIYNDLLNTLFNDDDFEIKENTIQQRIIEQLDFIKLNTEFYISPKEYFSKFDKFLKSKNNKLLISGIHGSGKTAFLANLFSDFGNSLKGWLPIVNFVDAGSESKDYNKIITQMVSQLNNVFPSTKEFLESANPSQILSDVFNSIPKEENILFILDGIEKIKQNDFFADLYWLPTEIPENIKIVFSTCDENLQKILIERNFSLLELRTLEISTQHEFINSYLLKFGKKLTPIIVEKIVKSKLSDNPFSLKVLLDELRIFGSHEELENHLGYYLDASNPIELFDKLLNRLEIDYEEKTKGLVGNTISTILLSNKGVLESELLEICNTAKLFWSPIFSALENYILQNGGLISINNASLAAAAKKRYLTSENSVKDKHENLAKYYSSCNNASRKIDEYAYHLFNSNSYEQLKNYIVQIDVFQKLYYADPLEFMNYFDVLKSRFNMADEYKNSIEMYEEDTNYNPNTLANSLSRLISLFGNNLETETTSWFAEKSYSIRTESFGEDSTAQAESLLDLAKSCQMNHDYEKGISYYKQAIEILNNNRGYKPIKRAIAYNGLSDSYFKLNNIEEAEICIHKSIEIFEQDMGDDNFAISACYFSLASIEQRKGNNETAIEYVDKAIEIAKQFGGEEHISVSWFLSLKADIYLEIHGDNAYDYSMPLYMIAYEIQLKELGEDSAHTLITALSMAKMLFSEGLFEDATEFLEEQYEHCKSALGDDHRLTVSYIELLLRTTTEYGYSLMKEEKYDEGIRILSKNFEKCKLMLGIEHSTTQRNLRMLIMIWESLSDDEKVVSLKEYLIE